MKPTQEISTLQAEIASISNKLLQLGDELLTLSLEQYNLKLTTYEHKLTQQEDIRQKQRGGCIILHEGIEDKEEKIKLTDPMRESLSEYGLKNKFAQYEANKKKMEILKLAVEAFKSALMGKQSSLNIEKMQFEIE